MFIGKYYYTLETKGRVSLPKPFRVAQKNWIITRGLDGSLFLFPDSVFQSEVEKLSKYSTNQRAVRDAIRLLSNDASEQTPDKLGRISIPEHLIAAAGLQKNVVIVGSLNKIEIWDRDTYHEYMDELGNNAESTVEQIDKLI
ncbi:MAG: division/cell wall cluster transcriptional repressor MraZ [Candidatus Pacebacteria bacterium]|nr:division/cell wall cluster transcriptional repressor MraZ [Candidatus Paceibacterota bacterium]PIR60696.1 MAG: division/cell wall cluster transcriptional repressor MraZ [Candidatus Pacebacteria bacterium CG10_big_fil_rev_8_21_14_0_10_44_54]